MPESLGNTRWVLPAGIVCDSCNNYFALKVERPLLDSGHFKSLRARQDIPNKRGVAPPVEGVLWGTDIELSMELGRRGHPHSLWATKERDSSRFVEHLFSHSEGLLVFPLSAAVQEKLLARLLAKVALEFFTERIYQVPGWEEPALDDPQLDALRTFARRGDRPAQWPYNERRIYAEDSKFIGENGEEYQTVHEADFLYTSQNELYSVVCIFGVEYAINMGGPDIDGYKRWLTENNDASPLYLKPQSPGAGRPGHLK